MSLATEQCEKETWRFLDACVAFFSFLYCCIRDIFEVHQIEKAYVRQVMKINRE